MAAGSPGTLVSRGLKAADQEKPPLLWQTCNASVVSYVTLLKRTRAAVVIQKNVRTWAAKRSYQQQRSAAVAIQSFLRAHVARKKYQQVTHKQHHPRKDR